MGLDLASTAQTLTIEQTLSLDELSHYLEYQNEWQDDEKECESAEQILKRHIGCTPF